MADYVRYRISTISYIDSGGGRNYMSGSTGVGYTKKDTQTNITTNYVNAEDESPYYSQLGPLVASRFQIKGVIGDTFEDILTHYNGNRLFWHRWRVEYYTWTDGSEDDFNNIITGTSYYYALNSGFHPSGSPPLRQNVWLYPEVKIGDKSIGIQIRNDQSELMIDGEYSNNIVIASGSVDLEENTNHWSGKEPDEDGSGTTGAGVEVTISFGITLTKPPLIAIKPHPISQGTGSDSSQANYNQCSKGCDWDLRGLVGFGRLKGSSGAWTGFSYWKNWTSKFHGVKFDWKALHPATAQSSEDYGFRVFDGLGDTGTDGELLPIFDSGHQYMHIVNIIEVDDDYTGSSNYDDYNVAHHTLASGFPDAEDGYHSAYGTTVAESGITTSQATNGWFVMNEYLFYNYHEFADTVYTANYCYSKSALGVKTNGTVILTSFFTRVSRTALTGFGQPSLPGGGNFLRRIPVCILR